MVPISISLRLRPISGLRSLSMVSLIQVVDREILMKLTSSCLPVLAYLEIVSYSQTDIILYGLVWNTISI